MAREGSREQQWNVRAHLESLGPVMGSVKTGGEQGQSQCPQPGRPALHPCAQGEEGSPDTGQDSVDQAPWPPEAPPIQ